MDEVQVSAQVMLLRDWPTDRLTRAYRLAVMDVHAANARGTAAQLEASEQEAAMFAEELVRRGAL